jgi:NAD(P)-dependent dehydrogenase (short-subunit alcohol dehydrogenase family)
MVDSSLGNRAVFDRSQRERRRAGTVTGRVGVGHVDRSMLETWHTTLPHSAEVFGANPAPLFGRTTTAFRVTTADLNLSGRSSCPLRNLGSVSVADQVRRNGADQVLARFGAVHVLCNNAGVSGGQGPICVTREQDR